MDQQQLRRSYITLPLPASPAAAASLATFIATHPMRIVSAQLCVSDSGAGGGATTVALKRNNALMHTTTPLSVAQGAAVNNAHSTLIGSVQTSPSGQGILPNDVITVDITAVPGGTPPKAVSVILSVTQLDV